MSPPPSPVVQWYGLHISQSGICTSEQTVSVPDKEVSFKCIIWAEKWRTFSLLQNVAEKKLCYCFFQVRQSSLANSWCLLLPLTRSLGVKLGQWPLHPMVPTLLGLRGIALSGLSLGQNAWTACKFLLVCFPSCLFLFIFLKHQALFISLS